MSDILNSLNINTNNTSTAQIGEIPFKKSENFVTAPDYLPTYSIDKVLSERDEFRRNVKKETNNTNKEKENALPKIISIAIAAIASILLMKKH